jgi:hypothetical protein
MTPPSARDPIKFHVASPSLASLKLDQRAQKIGSGLAIPESRMQDMDPPAILGCQLIPHEALMPPDLLHPKLWRRSTLAQGRQTAQG